MRQPVADNWSTDSISPQLARISRSNYLTDGMFIQSVRRGGREERGLIIIIITIIQLDSYILNYILVAITDRFTRKILSII